MTHINDPQNLGSDLFGYKINYNQREGLENPNTDFIDLKVKPKYNGNIAEVAWKTQTEENEPLKRYGYVYDGLNRLQAGFYQKAGTEASKEYFEKMDYDLNGNITRLQRSAELMTGSTTAMAIDNLRYDYEGNRLTKVTEEQIGNSKGYPYLATHNMITYDDNGNMTTHKDKGIATIKYNFLNLPDIITGTPAKLTKKTNYTYRADGVKVSKIYYQGSNYKITDYLDGFQYINTASSLSGAGLQFVPTAEGYFDFVNNVYIYNYTDHLGNVRLSYSDGDQDGVIQPRDMSYRECVDMGEGNIACTDIWKPGEIVEVNNYYPFGLMHNYTATTTNAYQYKYNGKELQETGMYDYGARFYMPDIGRWGVIDPLAEMTQTFSPYSYVVNNPVLFIDPDGMQVIAKDEDAQKLIHNTLNEMLGENHGFYFNKKGVLQHKDDKKSKDAKKNYTEDQNAIYNGFMEITSNEEYTINFNQQESDLKFTAEFKNFDMVVDNDGRIMQKNGKPILKEDGTSTFVDITTNKEGDTGGGVMITKPGHTTANSFIFTNIANKKVFKADGDKFTAPSLSGIVIHELLDHGLDFIRTGQNIQSSGSSLKNVNYQNRALKIIGSPQRVEHTHK